MVCRIGAERWLVTVIVLRIVARLEFVLVPRSIGRCLPNSVTRSGATLRGLIEFARPSPGRRRCGPRVLARLIHRHALHRHALADKPREFGKRVVGVSARRRFRLKSGSEVAVRTMIAFSHKVRPVSGVYAVQKASKPSTRISRLRLPNGGANQRSGTTIASRLAPRPPAMPSPMRGQWQSLEQAQAELRSVVDHSG
jgi:hypothetical protein